jgi:hypothetical protein
MRIALIGSASFPEFQRFFDRDRTPTGSPEWDAHSFHVNPTGGAFDAVIAFQSMRPLFSEVSFRVPPTRVALVVMEPPSLLELPESYETQFQRVLSQNPRGLPPRHILDQSGHGWFVERSIGDVLSEAVLPKTRMIATCTSRKLGTPAYARRVAFLEYCRDRLPFEFDWFGNGTGRPAARKIDALGPYKYQIVLENSAHCGYFTEKLADAFVSDCFPFYWGCPNIESYFPRDALAPLDLADFEGACRIIIDAIEHDAYARSQTARAEARRLCALKYNRYPTLLRLLEHLPPSPAEMVTIRPHDCFVFSGRERLRLRLRNLVGKARRAASGNNRSGAAGP